MRDFEETAIFLFWFAVMAGVNLGILFIGNYYLWGN